MEYVLPFEVGDAYKPGFRILEPSAGGGAFVTKLRKLYPEATIHACDLDETSGPWPEADKSWYGDFIEFASETDERYTTSSAETLRSSWPSTSSRAVSRSLTV